MCVPRRAHGTLNRPSAQVQTVARLSVPLGDKLAACPGWNAAFAQGQLGQAGFPLPLQPLHVQLKQSKCSYKLRVDFFLLLANAPPLFAVPLIAAIHLQLCT